MRVKCVCVCAHLSSLGIGCTSTVGLVGVGGMVETAGVAVSVVFSELLIRAVGDGDIGDEVRVQVGEMFSREDREVE